MTFTLPGIPANYAFNTSLWVVAFLGLLTGVLGTLLYTVLLSSKEALVRWRRRRHDLKAAGDSDAVLAGLRAAVRGDLRDALAHFE